MNIFDKIGAVAEKLIDPVMSVISEAVPDKDKQASIRASLMALFLKHDATVIDAQRDIIVAEAQSESWLTRNWRPITVLTFAGLVVAYWLGYTAPNITDEIVLKLLSIVQVALGGYVVGRSAEKVAENWNKK